MNDQQNAQSQMTQVDYGQKYYSPQGYHQFGQPTSGQQRQYHQPSNSTTIQNPQSNQQPRVKGPEMNDRDRLNDVLATQKYLTDNFNVFAREASHEYLFQDVMTILRETHQQGREMFNLMFEKGWYKLQAESEQQVSQTHQQFQNYQTQFPHNTSHYY